MSDLSNYRKSYEKSELNEEDIPDNPIALFTQWFKQVEGAGVVDEVNAMTVSTLGLDGFPKARVVLLKQFDEKGFIFYTNYNSEKGKAIAANPHVCLSFFWPGAERQVIIKGIAEKTSADFSATYFNTRPRGSRLGAVVSPQSEVISSRDYLEGKLSQLEEEFGTKEIIRPDHWGGYLVKPAEMEFWQGRANRLHDRIRYKSHEMGSWIIDRLAP